MSAADSGAERRTEEREPFAAAAGTSGPGRATLRALGSLLLGGLAVVLPILAVRKGVVPLVEALFGLAPGVVSAVRRVGILLAATLGYLGFVRWHERRAPIELRWRLGLLIAGGVGGALLAAVPIGIAFAAGAYELVARRGLSSPLLGVAALIGIAATLEELVYRGLLFRVLEGAWGTAAALAVQAVVFALPHLENLERAGAGESAVLLVAVTGLGLLWGALFVRTRNLWATAAHHAAWNFTILASGVPLSGIGEWRELAPLESRAAGPDWLTGGAFGPETSLPGIAVALLATVMLLRSARRRGGIVASGLRPDRPRSAPAE